MVIQAHGKTSSSDRRLRTRSGDCGIPDGLRALQLLEVLPHRPHLGPAKLLAAARLLPLDSKVVHGPGHHLVPHLHRPQTPITFGTYIIHVMQHQWCLQRSELEGVKLVVYAEGHVLLLCSASLKHAGLMASRFFLHPAGAYRTSSTIPIGHSSRPWLLELSSCAVGERGSCSETRQMTTASATLVVDVEHQQIMLHEARSA